MTITDKELERIRQAARERAERSAVEQGLPAKVSDPAVLEKVAALVRDEPEEDAA